MKKNGPVLCVIPARGGSKGIVNKNLATVHGQPLLVHTLVHATTAVGIDQVIVSTDSKEIAAVSEIHGAEVIFRPHNLSTDSASSESALLHVLDTLREQGNPDPSYVIFLQATSPLREKQDIDQALQHIRSEKADSLFSACRFELLVWELALNGPRCVNVDYTQRKRRQDWPRQVMENGSIYIFKPWVLRKLHNRLGGVIAVYQMDMLNSFQIDEPRDIPFIEHLFQLKDEQKS